MHSNKETCLSRQAYAIGNYIESCDSEIKKAKP